MKDNFYVGIKYGEFGTEEEAINFAARVNTLFEESRNYIEGSNCGHGDPKMNVRIPEGLDITSAYTFGTENEADTFVKKIEQLREEGELDAITNVEWGLLKFL